jgi:hypothetical protein
VEARHGIVAEQSIAAAGEGEVVAQVLDGLGEIEWLELVASGNPLVERAVMSSSTLCRPGVYAELARRASWSSGLKSA